MGAREFIGHDTQNRSRDGFPKEEKSETKSISTSRRSVNKAKLIITPLDSHRREAFASYPLGAGPLSTESVDEYISILRKEELCLKVTPDVEHPAISVLFPMSMQDPDLFKCLLVGAQSLHDWRRDPFHVNRSRTMLKLQNEAILSLRKRLSSPSAHLDDGVLISITHLMIADSCRRDLTSLKSHLKGARQIISLRGGLGTTPAHLAIRALVTTVEFYIALGQYLQLSPDDPTAIPNNRIEFIRHPFPPDICRDVATLPIGLAEAALSGHLSVQCIKLLASVASWAPLVNGSSSSSAPTKDSRDRYCRLFCEPRECSRSAIMLLLDLKRSGLPVGLEHVICLGLAIAVRHLSGENRTNIFDTASLAALTKNVKSIDNPSVPDSEVIIWLSLVISWRTQSAKPVPKADTLFDYVLDSFPASRSWKKVSVICRKFWWFERFQAEWEQCWASGIARQKQRSFLEQSQNMRSRRRSSIGPLASIISLQKYSAHIESG
ncbi:uncharacterized protein Z519_02013 [Cladophialophora bantiana CBS 173.52]|uniref:Uncharacterized protein n=1 Tax=Cladophialophora bantiana (strain ATCC 10958 / CBS 173.52 / CDC B-1940 / NIH 8579) TaxID=1442370 RepID=A0A0D2GE24_CLAB1|nr:uncharacterized protein Z519_02013 [Cladophialophora bantiana CBS 173.52]KIW96622.1 hypothetical protein Z519_02013 [Cladophialophora bantiana CBS 173.52]